QTITDLSSYYSLDESQLADTILVCPKCGRNHCIPFKFVRAGQDLIDSLTSIIDSICDQKPTLIGVVYDQNIEEKLTPLFFIPFERQQIPFVRLPIGESGLLLEASVEIGDKASNKVPKKVDFLIGVGSGVISDLTKWIATKLDIPFLLMGTAASMNAYTSITGSMTENNVKISKWLKPALAVLLDSDLLASAPIEMTCAGIGDILARNVCNADWKLSEKVRGTYFCPVPYKMMTSSQNAFLPLADLLGKNDPDAMEKLADAVLLSGYSMTMLDGETSPSSGSEHILSHFFDFQHEVFRLPKNLHGTQVGLATIIMASAYELLHDFDPNTVDVNELEHRRMTQSEIESDHLREFGEYGQVLDIVSSKKRIPDEEYRGYLLNLLNSWASIWTEVVPYLMPADEIRKTMVKAGSAVKLSQINRKPEHALQALLYGAHYRSRYTILDLFWELGLFPELAPKILQTSGVLED
ncbi:MAG: iron-containing alcohol dehydrogenase, partial [Anaerolineales bacterium]